MTWETYEVGGCVRDRIMNHSPKDIDYVVVGATVQDMLDAGLSQVGKDFPVFLDSKGNEFALARLEKKTGVLHTDFEVVTDGVTLKEDLRRRDLTINAMAMKPRYPDQILPDQIFGHDIYDPFGGQRDLRAGILRHIDDDGFREDPLRILRIARFLARWPHFDVAPETFALCKQMCADGMLKHLTPERIALEMTKTFKDGGLASRFFVWLRMVGGLQDTFPEVAALIDVPQPYKWHPEGDSFIHTMMVLDQARGLGTVVQFCALVHDLGKAVTPADKLPSHPGHEGAGVPIVHAMCDRLALSTELRNHGKLVAKYHMHIHKFLDMKASTIVRMFEALNHRQNQLIIHVLPVVSRCDARGRSSMFASRPYPNAHLAELVFAALAHVRARDLCTDAELKNVNIIKNRLNHEMCRIVDEYRDKHKLLVS